MSSQLGLSDSTQMLWGKSDRGDNTLWLPLFVHLHDAARMAGYLWDEWVPQGTKEVIAKEFGELGDPQSFEAARSLLVFLAGVHDIGKATPSFQSEEWHWISPEDGQKHTGSLCGHTRKAGFNFLATSADKDQRISHPLAGELILDDYLRCRLAVSSGIVNVEMLLHPRDKHSRAIESLTCILGAHHGRMPEKDQLSTVRGRWKGAARRDTWEATSLGRIEQNFRDDYCRPWVQARLELLNAAWKLSGMSDEWLKHIENAGGISLQSQSLLTALVIMADWLASNQTVCPLITLNPCSAKPGREVFIDDDGEELSKGLVLDNPVRLDERDERAWRRMNLEGPWSEKANDIPANTAELFTQRFHFPRSAVARPVQEAAVSIAKSVRHPGLLVIEAPMGEGKTEAALAAAEIFAERTHRGGVCFALPTMATTDAMFSRVNEWVDSLPEDDQNEKTIYLAHSKARLNEEYQGIIRKSWKQRFADINADEQIEDHQEDGSQQQRLRSNASDTAIASDWMSGRKKGVLSNFLICTVDQVLMAALLMKHVVLRQLALANKVVIIDECHAYDEYMREYLKSALTWLGSMGSPTIMLSATLPEDMRADYVAAYQKGIQAFEKEGKKTACSHHHSLFSAANIGVRRNHTIISPSPDECEMHVEKAHARQLEEAYPLLTYTDGPDSKSVQYKQAKAASGRSLTVRLKVIDDGLDTLCRQVHQLVGDEEPSGCIGVICDTVVRAQKAAHQLRGLYGNAVKLTHSRFIDIDRMNNENKLRTLLGPDATIHNGKRPHLLIVVGTQVLEQSLDIDFDAMISDVAPIDSLIQRLGRLHRHHRGKGESERPERLRTPMCFIRGIEQWDSDGPSFPDGIAWNTKEARGVYPQSRLEETLGVLGLTVKDSQMSLNLPGAIASDVRRVYGSKEERSHLVPSSWTNYPSADEARCSNAADERHKAQGLLFQKSDPSQTLVIGSHSSVNSNNDEDARCAVRDTTDSVQVILMQRKGDKVCLLPWVGSSSDGAKKGHSGQTAIAPGSSVSTATDPPDEMGKLMAQCSLTLPRSLSYDLDSLVNELEMGCSEEVLHWQDSRWVAGSLFVFLDKYGKACISGKTISYSQDEGLVVSGNSAVTA